MAAKLCHNRGGASRLIFFIEVMESEEEESVQRPPSEVPVQTRTLLHYFSPKNGSKPNMTDKKTKPEGKSLEEKEASSKRGAGIAQFFSKVTKEDYRKSIDEETAKITVKALVHHCPAPETASTSTVTKQKLPRRRKTATNVSRPIKETDKIQVFKLTVSPNCKIFGF